MHSQPAPSVELPRLPTYRPVVEVVRESSAGEQLAVAPSAVFGAKHALWIMFAYLCVYSGLTWSAHSVVSWIRGRAVAVQMAPGVSIGGLTSAALLGSILAYVLTQRLAWRSRQEFVEALGLRAAPAGQILLAVPLAIAGCVCTGLLFLFMPPPTDLPSNPLASAASLGGWPSYLLAVLAVVVAPLTEEFMFRGVLFTGLARSTSVFGAACASTLTFVLLHMPGRMPYWPALIPIAALSAVAQLLRVRTGSLLPGIVLHATHNACLVTAAFVAIHARGS